MWRMIQGRCAVKSGLKKINSYSFCGNELPQHANHSGRLVSGHSHHLPTDQLGRCIFQANVVCMVDHFVKIV